MRFKFLFLGLAVVAFACGLFGVSAQQPGDDEVRGAFLSSRPKTTNSNAPSRRHRPHKTNSNSNNNSSSAAKNTNTDAAATNANIAHNKNNSKNEYVIDVSIFFFLEKNASSSVTATKLSIITLHKKF